MYIKDIEEKTIIGLTARTKNEDEMNPSTSKIVSLWQKFDNNVTVDYQHGNRVYGLYFDYESDATGEFTVLAGTDQVNVQSSIPLESKTIQSGKYLVFEGTGDMPRVVIETWDKIWEYFSKEDCTHSRLYTTDFEYYVSPSEIKIYIAIA